MGNMKSTLILDETNLKQVTKIMMATSEIGSMKDLAGDLNIKETTFRSAINNNAIRLVDFVKMSKHMGYEVVVRGIEEE